MDTFDRRTILKMGAYATAAAAVQPFVGIPALAGYAVGPTVRRNVFGMSANDPILNGYRKAIRAMRALPDVNPCSWFYQAAIHGTTDPRGLTAWSTCHTNAGFFWAWHRMYLYWFERIVRKHSGMYDWAIPYWDWTNQAETTVPAPFRDTGSALYDATRSTAMNDGSGSISPSVGASALNTLTLLDYFNTQSAVNGPHGSVHVAFGLGSNMRAVETAAQDPIFWLHHAQVDRLWNLWLAQGGGRSSPVGDTTWRNTTYTFFDECCNKVQMKGCDVLRAAQQLSYTYEGEPPQVNQYCPLTWKAGIFQTEWVLRRPAPVALARGLSRIPLESLSEKNAKRLSSTARSRGETPFLEIKGVEAARQPGVSWEVHIGPAGFAPDNARSFVGTFALFSAGLRTRKHHYQAADFVFPIGKALRKVRAAEGLEVLLVPVSGVTARERPAPAEELRSEVAVKEINIGVDVAMPQPPDDEQDRLRKEELE